MAPFANLHKDKHAEAIFLSSTLLGLAILHVLCSQGYRLTPIEFEKDDERNFHAEFVAAAANLRAQNYGIPGTDKLQVHLQSNLKFVNTC